MKPAILSLVILMGVGGAYAQRGGGGGGMRGGGGGAMHGGGMRGGGAPRGGVNLTYPSVGITPYGGIPTTAHGFGSYMFPGTGTPGFGITTGVNTGFSTVDPSFASRLGATVGGWPAYTGSRGRGYGYGGSYIVPFGVPIGVPVSDYGYGYGYGMAPPPPQAAPPVIINQYYTPESVRPVMREYPPESLPEPPREQPAPSSGVTQYGPPARTSAEPRKTIADEKATIHLIALKDDRILPVIGYWVEGPDLNYITKNYSKGSVPLSQVDRPLSERLNRERNIEFELP